MSTGTWVVSPEPLFALCFHVPNIITSRFLYQIEQYGARAAQLSIPGLWTLAGYLKINGARIPTPVSSCQLREGVVGCKELLKISHS